MNELKQRRPQLTMQSYMQQTGSKQHSLRSQRRL